MKHFGPQVDVFAVCSIKECRNAKLGRKSRCIGLSEQSKDVLIYAVDFLDPRVVIAHKFCVIWVVLGFQKISEILEKLVTLCLLASILSF
ncbi:hypothetical protein WL83_16170 [Burkholderia ubonensis]|nr:hypothetical protein WL83_16170 [Burkholderia ubonensis]